MEDPKPRMDVVRDPRYTCPNDLVWLEYIGHTRHEKTETEINNIRITKWYKPITVDFMHELVDGYDCDTYIVLITGWDTGNGRMMIQTIPIPKLPIPEVLEDYNNKRGMMMIMEEATVESAKPFYSFHNIAIFKWIFHHYADVGDFHFFKAEETVSGVTRTMVVFKVYDSAGVLIYCGDLSGLP